MSHEPGKKNLGVGSGRGLGLFFGILAGTFAGVLFGDLFRSGQVDWIRLLFVIAGAAVGGGIVALVFSKR